MWDLLARLFDSSGFPARWRCGTWTPAHGWLHILSDTAIWGAYLAIPCVLGYYVVRRQNLPFRGIFLLFGAFILLCGTTHLMEAIIFWWPGYRLAGSIKLATALVSWGTVLALVRVTPEFMALRSPVELEREIADRKKAEEALRASEERFRAAFDFATIGMALVAPDGRWLRVNRSLCELVGYAEGELLAADFQSITHPDDLGADLAQVRALLAGEITTYQMEKRYLHKDGHVVHVLLSVSLVRDGGGAPLYFISQIQDVTQRKRAEELTRASLREKEVLLREIHHRVKNNLQIVSTLLDLQSDHTRDERALELFRQSRGRVKSMALIHERLYRSQDLTRIEFAEYVRQLADDLYRTYKVSSDEIALAVEVDVPPLPIDVAIPCGLLMNELMSNCLKHAFGDASGGWIRVALHGADGRNVLTVADNGAGFPPGIDFRNSQSFGLQLVTTLVAQLQGRIELNSEGGTAFTVTFPVKD